MRIDDAWTMQWVFAPYRRLMIEKGIVMKMKAIILAASAAIGLASSAHAATFDAGVLDFQYYSYGSAYNGSGSPASFATPTGSVEFGGYFTVSAAGNQITYHYDSDTTWSPSATSLQSGALYIDNGSLLTSVSGIPAFTSVTIDPSSMLGASGFNASDVTFDASNVAVTWMNLNFAAGDTVVLDVNSAATPEPATWALMLVGFGLVGSAMRKRSSVRTTVAYT